MAAPFLGSIGGYLVNKVQSWFGGGSKKPTTPDPLSYTDDGDPKQKKNFLGRLVGGASSLVNSDLFTNAMKQFGDELYSRKHGLQLPNVNPMQQAGEVFYTGLRGAMDILKNGGNSSTGSTNGTQNFLPSQQQLAGNQGDSNQLVEKSAPNQQPVPGSFAQPARAL